MRSLNWISAKSLMSAQHEWGIWLRSNEGISLIKIHSLNGFCFYPVIFFLYISNRIVYFYLKYYELCFKVKVEGVPSQQLKHSISLHHDIIVNTHCHVTMGLWWCLGKYVMSQWIGDVVIDTKQSCDKQPESFIQDPGKHGSFTQDLGVEKTSIFQLKNWN